MDSQQSFQQSLQDAKRIQARLQERIQDARIQDLTCALYDGKRLRDAPYDQSKRQKVELDPDIFIVAQLVLQLMGIDNLSELTRYARHSTHLMIYLRHSWFWMLFSQSRGV